MFEGERLITNFLGGKVIQIFLKADFILSFASFTEVSASQTISIVGKDLLESASTVIKKLSSQIFETENTLEIIKRVLQDKQEIQV
jgi:hypothetical protein